MVQNTVSQPVSVTPTITHTPPSIPAVSTQVKSEPPVVSTPRPNFTPSKFKSTNVDIELPSSGGQTNQANEPAISNISANKPFTLEQLRRELHTFADSRNNATIEVMLKREFNLVEGHILKLRLDNQVQMDLLTQMKQDLAVYLRQQLQNNTIQIASEIVESQVERRPYTAQEKFEYLANKNPALWDLKEKLGMDLVF